MTAVYRDLAADRAGKHHGKPCDHCGRPIGHESYSHTDGAKFCTKRCSLNAYRLNDWTISLPPEHVLYFRSMGKALRITAIAFTVDAANARMEKYGDEALVAEIGKGEHKLYLLADRFDRGIKIHE